MLPLHVFRVASRVLPDLASGRALHHRALAANAAGSFAEAERWFEAAARAYRAELAVEPLARLRVHQRMSRARAGTTAAGEAAAMIDIVRSLNRLDRLESLEAPFALADARSVLAEWITQPESVPVGPAPLLAGGAAVA
jgi:hypothetical protein